MRLETVGSVVAKLECRALCEIAVKEFIPASVVAIDGEQKLRVPVIVVIASIDEPHACIQKRNFPSW